MQPIHLSPVSAGRRIQVLDMLRGLAIFGILMVNMQIFYQPMTQMLAGYAGSESKFDLIAEIFIKMFFEGKFYVLFSMLFGYGFYLFIHKEEGSGINLLPLFRRRLFILLLFGALHIVLLWPGDILVFYALFGFALLLFRKVSDRGLIRWAIGFGLFPVILIGIISLFMGLARSIPEAAAEIDASMAEGLAATGAMIERARLVYSSGSFSEMMSMRLIEYRAMLPGVLFFYPVVLAMFLIGYWAARKGFMQRIEENKVFFRKLRFWGLVLGIPFSAMYTYGYLHSQSQVPDTFTLLSSAGHILGGFTLSLFYVSSMVLLWNKEKCLKFGNWLAPVGRMALTNYLMHSVVCSTLFYGYGFGLYGKINPPMGILITIIIFAFQIPLSHLWLKHFQFGPFEWLWRSLTYLKWQPLQRNKI